MNEQILNGGNPIHNFISSSGSDFFNKLQFRIRLRFHYSKSYGSYGSGSGSTTLGYIVNLSHAMDGGDMIFFTHGDYTTCLSG